MKSPSIHFRAASCQLNLAQLGLRQRVVAFSFTSHCFGAAPCFPLSTAMVSVEDINTQWALLTEWLSSLLSFIGLSSLVDTVSINSTYLHESAKLLILGSVIEAGRRLSQWLMERFKFRGPALFASLLWPSIHIVLYRLLLVGAI